MRQVSAEMHQTDISSFKADVNGALNIHLRTLFRKEDTIMPKHSK